MTSSGPILGIDYGRRRCGLARSDEGRLLASSLPTCERGRRDLRQMPRVLRERLTQLREEIAFDAVVFGWPDAQSEASSELRDEIRRVAQSLLELWPLEIAFWDESFTSVEATRQLRSASKKIRREKGAVDRVAARILLQEFLDAGCPFDQTPATES